MSTLPQDGSPFPSPASGPTDSAPATPAPGSTAVTHPADPDGTMNRGSLLVRNVRLISAARTGEHSPGSHASDSVVDLRIEAGRITDIGPDLAADGDIPVLEADGAYAIPGLWDQHVHVGQTAANYSRISTAGLSSVDELQRYVREQLEQLVASGELAPGDALVGMGHRLVDMAGQPTVAALDDISDTTPIVLIGGDAHHAWMNSPALAGLGLEPREGIVAEDDWFEVVPAMNTLPGVADRLEHGVTLMQNDALARGIVGLRDMEWSRTWEQWARREVRLRVRTATYERDLHAVPGPSGTPIGDSGLVVMGPLKVILDGALGSRSAYCRHSYLGPDGTPGHGVLSWQPERLIESLRIAQDKGLNTAVHAIGDAASQVALEGIAATGIAATIEHAQMLADDDVAGMASHHVVASVQPLHLLDDRDPTIDMWPDYAWQAYRFGDLSRAGVPLAFGSDSPVAPLDPWGAMAAAVHRTADDRGAWEPEQALQPIDALAASVDGVLQLAVGGAGDVVLLEKNVFADVPARSSGALDEEAARAAAAELRAVRPLATIVAGHIAFSR